MLDFTKLWDKRYLFGPNPIELSRSDHIFFWTALVFLVAGILARIFVAKDKPGSPAKFLFSRFFHLFITIGLLILVWVGSRFENIPWLSAHIVVLALLSTWLIWLVFIGKYFVKDFRRQQKIWEDEELKRKYLKGR